MNTFLVIEDIDRQDHILNLNSIVHISMLDRGEYGVVTKVEFGNGSYMDALYTDRSFFKQFWSKYVKGV